MANKKRALRVYFATDIHGSDRCFRKFLAAAKVYEADALVLGGDIAGKGLVPIRSHNGSLSARVRGELVTVRVAEEERLRAEINRIGFYSVIAGEDEFERMEDDAAYLSQAFTAAIAEQVEGWCRLAEERLDSKVRIGPVLLASCGDVTPTPWNTEREFQEDELAERLSAILDPAPKGAKVVANFHNPPYGSGLDFAAELDETLLPVIRGGRPSIIPVGSKAVREVIKKYQPVVGLHGHIHESKGAQRIGTTMCFNPGSEYSSDVLRGVLVDFDGAGDYLDFLFTAG